MFKRLISFFRGKPKPPKRHILLDRYSVVEAFKWNGETYYMHEDPLNTAAGRGLTSLMYYEELIMRCDVAYLQEYCKAVRAIFSDPRKIDIMQLATITAHLEERVSFLAAIPEHVFKLASVVFFTMDESPFTYDQKKGAERVKEWQAAEGMYDFFLQTPLKVLIPSLVLPEQNSQAYLTVLEKINHIHCSALQGVLSKSPLPEERMN